MKDIDTVVLTAMIAVALMGLASVVVDNSYLAKERKHRKDKNK